jgi:tRNA (guanine37-N1)-methyltransferase
VLSKNTKAKHIIGIEINPEGHKYGLNNISLNKLNNISLYNGDVRDVVPKLKTKFDRILMPLPKTAEEFLDTALLAAKKGTVIHLYAFLNESEFDVAKQAIKDACKEANMNYKILSLTKCGQHAPRVYRICIDFKITSAQSL